MEESLQIWCHSNKRGFFSGIGSEIAPSVVTAHITCDDYLIPRYRGFAAMIGMGMAPEKIFGEFMRKACGAVKGIGDIASIHDASLGIYGHSVVMGAGFGTAVGLGLAVKYQQEKRIVVCFFGDGEASRSTFASALNMAALWSLPILFVCENNGISIDIPLKLMSATKSIAERAAGYNIPAATVQDIAVPQLIAKTEEAVNHVRSRRTPFLLEILEERFAPHISVQNLKPFLGRDIPEDKDPLLIFKNFLIESGTDAKLLQDIETDARAEVERAFTTASRCPNTDLTQFNLIYHE